MGAEKYLHVISRFQKKMDFACVLSIFLSGWLYGVIHTDLLRDGLALVRPVDRKILQQLKDYYSHTRVVHVGPIWLKTFLAHFASLLVLSLFKVQHGVSLGHVAPTLCVLVIVAVNSAFLEPAKLKLLKSSSEDDIVAAGKSVFFYHSVLAVLCVAHIFFSL